MKKLTVTAIHLLCMGSLISFAACGGDGGNTDSVDAGQMPDARVVVGGGDFDDKQWRTENASDSQGTLSHDGVIVEFQGALWGAFSEPDSTVVFDQDIVSMRRNTSGWTSEARSAGDSVQFAFPDLDVRGSTAHLVYSGPSAGEGTDNDIVYASYADSSWVSPVDLTTPDELGDRGDIRPKLMVYSGEISVAYLSYTLELDGSPSGPSELRVMSIDGTRESETVYAPVDPDDCFDLDAVVVPNGDRHIILDCGQGSATTLFHATDASGDWVTTPVPIGDAQAAKNPKLALYGNQVHLVFGGASTCGGGACTKAYYAPLQSDGSFATPTKVLDSELEEQHSTIAVLDSVVVIAFHRFNGDGFADIFVTYSLDDGANFAAPENLSPGTPASDEWKPASLMFTADGNAHFVYDQVFADQDPLNSDVIHAYTR